MFTDPVKNLRALGLGENDIVADLGAGTGFYSVAAGKIAYNGKVYAVDLHNDFLATIKDKAKTAEVKNVETIRGNAEKIGGTGIGDAVVDAVIASNVLSQAEDRENFLRELSRILKPGGKVLFIDWSDSSELGIGEPISPNKAKEMFERKGFVLNREISAGEHHYGMIFNKSK